jgi:hypothetical protein
MNIFKDKSSLAAIICGFENSGVNLLTEILNKHSSLYGQSAGFLLEQKTNSFILREDFCTRVKQGWCLSDADLSHIGNSRSWKEIYNRLQDRSLAIENKNTRIFDSTTKYMSKLSEVLEKVPDVPCIVMIRDIRAVIWSAIKRSNLDEQYWIEHRSQKDYRHYHSYVTGFIEAIEKDFSHQLILVRYELLCTNFHEEIKRILDFIGLEVEENIFPVFESRVKKASYLLTDYKQYISNQVMQNIVINTGVSQQWLWNDNKYQIADVQSYRNVIVAGVCVVKDEEDIIYHNLLWHYHQGIKRFVVMDNMSTDNTQNEIRRFADQYSDTLIYLMEDREKGHYQSRKLTAAAEFAHRMWKAEWILPFDGDEILCSLKAPLLQVLASLNKEDLCISLPWRNHVLRTFDDYSKSNPLQRMTHRQKSDSLGIKVMIRWQTGMLISQGNHSVHRKGKISCVPGHKIGLLLRHYRFRSKNHLKQKFMNKGKAYEAAPDLPEGAAPLQKKWYKEYLEGGETFIEDFYDNEVNEYQDAVYDPAIL